MNFGEWTYAFGISEYYGEFNEGYEVNLNLNDHPYQVYLEVNSYEHQLDQYRAQIESLQYTERKQFDFKPESETELLSLGSWVRRERCGVLREVEELTTPGTGQTHERLERMLKLYGTYLKEPTPEGSTAFDDFGTHITEGHKRQVTELTHKVTDDAFFEATDLTSPTRANDELEREPMSFAAWSNSPLAWRSSYLAKNSNASLLVDLGDYTAYLRLSRATRS